MPLFGEDREDILLILICPFVPDSSCPIVDVLEPGDLDRLGVWKRDLSPSWTPCEG